MKHFSDTKRNARKKKPAVLIYFFFMILTVQIKCDPVFATVASAEDEHLLRDFTNKVHIKALKRNNRINDNILATTTI